MITNPRGFTLLIAVVLTSVILSVGLALLDVAYKQVTLSSTARYSQYAFYAADSALECALYWDQQLNAFNYGAPLSSGSLSCGGRAITGYTSVTAGSGADRRRDTTFSVACAAGGNDAQVRILKEESGETSLYAYGYSSCSASDPRRIERGLRATY